MCRLWCCFTKGENVKMEISKGRNRVEKYTDVIESVYPSIFTVRPEEKSSLSTYLSYSYAEVLCGDVVVEKNI